MFKVLSKKHKIQKKINIPYGMNTTEILTTSGMGFSTAAVVSGFEVFYMH